jgi:hypothetical protein
MLSKKLVRFTTLGLTLALAAITLIRVYPVFQGELFGWQAKVEFPASYWQLQEFMATQNPTATVIHLPQPNYWGWLFYDWGYRGSGFMWQLISQPLLDRNFDAWSLTNQTAYQELNLALEKADPNLVSQVLEKYGLELAIFDASVLNSNINNPLVGPQKNTELQALLLEAGATEIWHQDKLYVYHFPTSTLTERLSLTDTYQTVSNQSLRVVRDSIYEHEGQYLNLNPKQAAAAIPAVYYPFAAGQSEKLSHLTCTSNQCQVRASFPSGQSGVEKETAPFDYRLLLPALTKQERVIINGSAWFSDPQTIQIKFEPTLHLEIAGQKKLLPGLDSLTLVEVATTQTRAIVDFGDRKPYLVTPERLTDFAVEMVVGVPMTIKVFDAGELTQLTADNVQVAENQVQAYDFPAQIWDKLLQTQELVLTSDQTLAASWEAPSFTLALASQTGHNCDVTSRGQAQKKILLQGASYYAADSANLCESYNLADLSSLNNYVVQFLVEPQQGQPLKFSIIDEASQRLLLDQRLDEQQREQYFFIPRLRLWRNQQHNLFFYLSAQSYGQPSVNTVTNIRLIQYPIEYLSQIKLIPLAPTNVTNLGQIPVGGQKYQLATSNQINASRYLATVAPVASLPKQDQVLVLTRSYDQNWRARARSETGRWQTLVHHRFNGWANAWLLPSPTTTAWQIQLTYWPQQLVVGGLALLGLELLAIISFELCQMWGRCRHFFRFKATKPRRFFK